MAYDAYLAERIRQVSSNQRFTVIEKKMMGGLCFMLDDKMYCGIHFSKRKSVDLIMVALEKKWRKKFPLKKDAYQWILRVVQLKGISLLNQTVMI